MLQFWLGLFVILHGLVHLWYVTLSQQLVAFQPAMGWSGRSWLLTGLLGDGAARTLASALYLLAALALVAGGVGIFLQAGWWRPMLAAAAIISTAAILLFWDGSLQMVVQKGLIGLLINAALLALVALPLLE